MSRLNYNQREISDAEPELGLTIKRTLNVNDLNVLNFRIPADGERFSDLNTMLLSVEFSIVQSNGKNLGDKDKPFIDFNGISSLFSSCDVKFDGEIVSSMGNYAYSAALAYMETSDYSASEIARKSLEIASKICIYTNNEITVEELE